MIIECWGEAPVGRRAWLRAWLRAGLRAVGAGSYLLLVRPLDGVAATPVTALEHPDPRPGVDGSNVLSADELTNPAAASVYERIREIPRVADGIRCHCGCADLPGYYSLLSCYESGGMAQFCDICQGEGRLVHRLHTEGRDLQSIRAAVDRTYG